MLQKEAWGFTSLAFPVGAVGHWRVAARVFRDVREAQGVKSEC